MDDERKQQLAHLLENPVFNIHIPDETELRCFDQALTHSSFANEQRAKNIVCEDNERLEFFGDCILDFIIGQELFDSFPERIEDLRARFPKKKDEALLTDMLHDITNDEQLFAIVATIGSFDRAIRCGSGQELTESIMAGAFEAFVAAVFHTKGIEKTRSIVQGVFRDRIRNAEPIVSWKNRLQECIQNRYQPPQIDDILKYDRPETVGPDGLWHTTVWVNNQQWGKGKGKKRQDAEKDAAKNAFETHCADR
jgi:ribonuclease III